MPSTPRQNRGFIDGLSKALAQKLKPLPDSRVVLRSGPGAMPNRDASLIFDGALRPLKGHRVQSKSQIKTSLTKSSVGGLNGITSLAVENVWFAAMSSGKWQRHAESLKVSSRTSWIWNRFPRGAVQAKT